MRGMNLLWQRELVDTGRIGMIGRALSWSRLPPHFG